MSLRATLWVLDEADHITDAVQVLILVAIADQCNDEGEGARLGVPTIASRARVDKRTAQRHLSKLEEAGQLTIDRQAGRGRWSTYTLHMTTSPTPKGGDLSPIPDDDMGGETVTEGRQKGDTAAPPSNDGLGLVDTPQPPASGGRDATHRGQHPNCRGCGTNRRGPAAADPEAAAHAARSAAVAAPDARRANPCKQCQGDKLIEALGGAMVQCPRCSGGGVEPSRRVS